MSTAAAPRDWDAETYHRVSDPQTSWGMEVLERLALRGDEVVLDAGCGTGRVTRALADRLPRGRVVAVDGSPSMVAKARETLGPDVEVLLADLSDLVLEAPVEVVFSTATFHWIADHDSLYRRLFEALRAGGRLVAQCGGKGNVAALAAAVEEVARRAPFHEHFADWRRPWNFRSAEETVEALRRAGFEQAYAWLEPKPVRRAGGADFLRTCTLGPHVDRLPAGLADEFTHAVAELMPKPLVLDYVRLNMSARRP